MAADITLLETSDLLLDEGRISADHYRTLEGRIAFWGVISGGIVMWLYHTYGDFGFWAGFPFWIAFLALSYGWLTAKVRRVRDLGYSGTSFFSVVGGGACALGFAVFVAGLPLGSALALGYALFQACCLSFYFSAGQRFDSRFGAYPAIYTETPTLQGVSWLVFIGYAGLVAYITAVHIGITDEQLTQKIGHLPFMEGVADYTFEDWIKVEVPIEAPTTDTAPELEITEE